MLNAADRGHERLVESLMQRGADVNLQSSDSTTALTFAANDGHERVVELLLRHSADVNVQTSTLTLAAMNGHERVVKLLRGAEVPT